MPYNSVAGYNLYIYIIIYVCTNNIYTNNVVYHIYIYIIYAIYIILLV